MFPKIKRAFRWISKKFKQFFASVVIMGFFWTITLKIIGYIDNAIVYDPRLQSKRKVRKILSKAKPKQNYAILVSGRGTIMSWAKKSKRNLQEAYDALKERGYTDSGIIILSTTIPKGRQLKLGITARPLVKNLNEVLSHTIKQIKPRGSILFYFTGEGDQIGEKSTMMLGNDDFKQKGLHSYFKLFRGKKIFIFDQNYSGGFAGELRRLPNIVIVASTKKDKIAITQSSVNKTFWEKISKGEKIKKAYKDAVRENGFGHRLITNIIQFLSLGAAKNNHFVYGRENIRLPEIK